MNNLRHRKLFLVAIAVLLWTCMTGSVRAGIMAGVLDLRGGEATVRSPGGHGPQPVMGSARLSEGDVVTVRRGTASVTFFDNGRASLDAGVTYRVSAFGLERQVGESSLLVHQFREKLSRQSLMKNHPLAAATVGTVVPVAETKVRRGGQTAWQLVTTPQTLLVNDQVWTGPRGAARLVANDGTVAQLRDGTRVYTLADGIEIEAGGCLINVPGKSFRVRTPSVVALAQKALFEVAQGQGASIRAFRGKVAARNRPPEGRRARTVRLAEGQAVEISGRGAMSRPSRFTEPADARQLAAAILGQMTAPSASVAPAPRVAPAPVMATASAVPAMASRPGAAVHPVPRQMAMAAPAPVAAASVPVLRALSSPVSAAAPAPRLPRSLPVQAAAPVQSAAAHASVDLPSPSDFFETATPYQERIGFADSLQPPPILVPTDEDLRTAERLLAAPAATEPTAPSVAPAYRGSMRAPVSAPVQTAAVTAPVQAATATPSLPSWQSSRQTVSAGTAPAARSATSSGSGERRWAQAPQETTWPEGLPRPGVTVTGKNVATF